MVFSLYLKDKSSLSESEWRTLSTYSPISSPIQIIGMPILVIWRTTPSRIRLKASSPKIDFSLPREHHRSAWDSSRLLFYLIQLAFDHGHDFQCNWLHWSLPESLAADNRCRLSIGRYPHYRSGWHHVMSSRNCHANLNRVIRFTRLEIFSRERKRLTAIHGTVDIGNARFIG